MKNENNALYEMAALNKEGHVLFNDALDTFYLRLYDVGHMVKDHSDSERGNLFPISSNGSFICTILQTGWLIPRHFGTPVVEHWLEREIAQWRIHQTKTNTD